MGLNLSCDCLTETLKYTTNQINKLSNQISIENPNLIKLQQETKFQKKVLLGMTSQEIILKLSDDHSYIIWKMLKNSITSTFDYISGNENKFDFGQINLVDNIATIRSIPPNGFAFIDYSNKIILEVITNEIEIKDLWINTLNELLQDWITNPSNKPKISISAAGTSNKSEYFAMREKEIEENKKNANEKRKKYASNGMKYTAIAMMNRDNN